MFAAACRIAVEKGGFRLAWIGMLDPPSHHLQIKAHAGADGGTLEILNAMIEADPPPAAVPLPGAPFTPASARHVMTLPTTHKPFSGGNRHWSGITAPWRHSSPIFFD